MGAMAFQIARLTIAYLTVYSGADQRKHQSSASLAFVRGIHWWPVNSPHKGPVTRKMFLFDDVIMQLFIPQHASATMQCVASRAANNRHRQMWDCWTENMEPRPAYRRLWTVPVWSPFQYRCRVLFKGASVSKTHLKDCGKFYSF